MHKKNWTKTLLTFLLCLLPLLGGQALANEGGKASAEGGGLTAPLEPFTVNLMSFDRYLQISITVQVAHPEISDKIKALMPMVRHSLLMLLSAKESQQLQSADGKHELMEEIKDKINKVLDVKEHDGVTDVYFVNFVIQ